jgi:hypothetical protein
MINLSKTAGPNVVKLFTSVIQKCSLSVRIFVRGKIFQHNIMFAGKVLHSGVGFGLTHKTLLQAVKACEGQVQVL